MVNIDELRKMIGQTTAIVIDTPTNRNNYVSAEINEDICDNIMKADTIKIVHPREESYVFSIMLENWISEWREDEEEQFYYMIKDMFFGDESRIFIAHTEDITTYILIY